MADKSYISYLQNPKPWGRLTMSATKRVSNQERPSPQPRTSESESATPEAVRVRNQERPSQQPTTSQSESATNAVRVSNQEHESATKNVRVRFSN